MARREAWPPLSDEIVFEDVGVVFATFTDSAWEFVPFGDTIIATNMDEKEAKPMAKKKKGKKRGY